MEGRYVSLSRFWHPGVAIDVLPLIAMVDVYCDESHDEHTYALAGWIAPPSAWDHFEPEWKRMLGRFSMPDGSAVPGFHSAEIVCRDEISDSRFKGWSFEQEKGIFTAAVDLLATEPLCSNVWSVGCCVAVPSRRLADPDEIWHMLFAQLLVALIFRYPAQNGFSLMFDEKPEVAERVFASYRAAKEGIEDAMPGKLAGSTIAFGDDEDHVPLQAADLMAYEWRRHTSERIAKPTKTPRTSYRRLRDLRVSNSMLQYYDQRAVLAALLTAEANKSSVWRALWDAAFTRD